MQLRKRPRHKLFFEELESRTAPAVVGFSSGSYTALEGGNAVAFLSVVRTGDASGWSEVWYDTAAGTAQAGVDYTTRSARLTFAPGQRYKNFTIAILNDSIAEPDEAFSVKLRSPSGASLGTVRTATVKIADVDDDPASQVGQWGPVFDFGFQAVHTSLLPTGQLLYWTGGSHEGGAHVDGIQLYDPATGSFAQPGEPLYDLFCAGHAFLPDGRLLVTGGHYDFDVGLAAASVYDPFTDSWSRLPDMNAGRWYPTNTTLANGDMLVVSGAITPNRMNNAPQVWDVTLNTWRDLPGASGGQFELPYYPYMFLAPNGKVFDAGPDAATRYLNTAGGGQWTAVATAHYPYRQGGSAVMYDDGKVLIAGGWSGFGLPTRSAEVIDLNAPTPAWTYTSSMAFGRMDTDATLLADGSVFVNGGLSSPDENLASSVYAGEIWDPDTGQWSTTAASRLSLGYHSSAVLLPDGRVLVAGGGPVSAGYLVSEESAQIYSPPYLFRGPRPSITAAPAQTSYGSSFFVETPDAGRIERIHLIRLSSTTHSFNQNQRISRLTFAPAAGGLDIVAPSDPNLAPPGHYMLFLLDGNGVPSEARIIQITATSAPNSSLLFSDTFTRPNRSWLGPNWQEREGNFSIASRRLVSAVQSIATVAGRTAENVKVAASVNVYTNWRPKQAGLVARVSAGGDLYSAVVTGTWRGVYRAYIQARIGGAWTTLATAKLSRPNGRLEFQAAGSSLTLRFRGVTVATAQDSRLTSGGYGVRGLRGLLDNFAATSVLTEVFRADFSDAAGAPTLDGFTIDNSGGDVAGLWHLTDARYGDAGHSAGGSLYFGAGEGFTGGGDYDVGHTAGSVTSAVIDLSAATAAVLSFTYFLDVQPDDAADLVTVSVAADGGTFQTVAAKESLANSADWKTAFLDLTPFVGGSIQVRFEFDTIDDQLNAFEGWYLGDVVIQAS